MPSEFVFPGSVQASAQILVQNCILSVWSLLGTIRWVIVVEAWLERTSEVLVDPACRSVEDLVQGFLPLVSFTSL